MSKEINITVKVIHEQAEPTKPKYLRVTEPDIGPGYNADDYRRKVKDLLEMSIKGELGVCSDKINALLERHSCGWWDDIPDRRAKRFYMRLWYLIDRWYDIERPIGDED